MGATTSGRGPSRRHRPHRPNGPTTRTSGYESLIHREPFAGWPLRLTVRPVSIRACDGSSSASTVRQTHVRAAEWTASLCSSLGAEVVALHALGLLHTTESGDLVAADRHREADTGRARGMVRSLAGCRDRLHRTAVRRRTSLGTPRHCRGARCRSHRRRYPRCRYGSEVVARKHESDAYSAGAPNDRYRS